MKFKTAKNKSLRRWDHKNPTVGFYPDEGLCAYSKYLAEKSGRKNKCLLCPLYTRHRITCFNKKSLVYKWYVLYNRRLGYLYPDDEHQDKYKELLKKIDELADIIYNDIKGLDENGHNPN
jgi:hypothetical protein